jgi:uncharacterized protein YjiS (DUF1127 family)
MDKGIDMIKQVLTVRSSAPAILWGRIASAACFVARHRTARALRKLNPRQVRDIGRPEDNAQLRPEKLRDWLGSNGL